MVQVLHQPDPRKHSLQKIRNTVDKLRSMRLEEFPEEDVKEALKMDNNDDDVVKEKLIYYYLDKYGGNIAALMERLSQK